MTLLRRHVLGLPLLATLPGCGTGRVQVLPEPQSPLHPLRRLARRHAWHWCCRRAG